MCPQEGWRGVCREEEELFLPAANVNPHDVAEGRQTAIRPSEGWLVAVILLDIFHKLH